MRKQNIIIRLLQNQLGLCLKIMSIELQKKEKYDINYMVNINQGKTNIRDH